MVKPLLESLTFDQAKMQILHEGEGENKDLKLKGVFIQGGVKNQNQRVYPLEEIKKAVSSVDERLKSGYSVLGEADHPEELTVNLDRVSHMVENMWMEDADGIGKLKILPTPMGNIVKTLLESGAKLGVSSRGTGNVNESGNVSDFEIVTVDIVAQPSAPDAYPKAIYEGLMNMKGGRRIYGLGADSVYDRRAEHYLKDEIMKLINELKL